MIAWAGSFVLSSAVLSLAYSEMSDYRELGRDAESRGEDPERFYRSYDRMGWIATTAGLGVILSGVMVLKSAHGREVVTPRILPPVIDWPPVPEKEPPPLAKSEGAEPDPAAKLGAESGTASHADDPVAQAIRQIEAARPDEPSADVPAPVVTQKTTTKQAWLPGTKPEMIGETATAPAAVTPDSTTITVSTAGKPGVKPPPVTMTPDATAPVMTQKTSTQLAWLPDTSLDNAPEVRPPQKAAASPESAKAHVAVTDSAKSAVAKAVAKPSTNPGIPAPSSPETSAAPAGVAPPPASPAPAASSPAKPFSLHVGSHRSLTNANREAQRWSSLGYAVRVTPADLGEKGKWFRLFIGEFATPAEAKKFLAEFQQEFPGQYAYVLRR